MVSRCFLPFPAIVASVLLLASTPPPRAAELPPPDRGAEAALVLAKGLAAARYGVERHGHLWAWSPNERRVELVSAEGELLPGFPLESARALDVDAEWGVVAVSRDGSSLHVIPAEGAPRDVALGDEVADVVWLGPKRVAVSTTRASWALAIVDLTSGAVVRRFLPASEIDPPVAPILLRSLRLDVSHDRQRLFALESLRGDLRVFTLTGDEVAAFDVDFAGHPGLDEWARDLGPEATSGRPLVTVLELALDEDGNPWTVTDCGESRRRATLVRPDVPAGEAARREIPVGTGCCSRSFALWGQHIVFTHRERLRPEVCVAAGSDRRTGERLTSTVGRR